MRMHKSIPFLVLFVAGLLTAAAPVWGQGNMPKVTASALANKTAGVAGSDLKLLVKLEIPDDVHIYWRSPGGTGLPTKIEWSGPPGVSFGRTQFPAPQLKYDETLKENSYVITGTAMFVTPVTIAKGVSADSLDLKATVSWLACRKGQCVPDGAELSVTLPVAASAKPANADAFEEAEWSLPVSMAKAANAKISGKSDAKALKAGATFTATLVADIEKHHHMQSHKPLEDYLVPAIVFLEPTPGLEYGEINYPKGKVRNDEMLGKLSEYAGKTEFRIPVKVTDEYDPARTDAVRGVLQYQICNDSGTCFPPQMVAFEIPIGDGKGSKTTALGNNASAIANDDANESKKSSPATDQKSDTKKAAATNDESDIGWLARSQNYLFSFGYAGVLVMAFIGGMVLNLMPCVLPVISLKVMSFVKQAGEDRGRVLILGITYCLGILTFFSVLAALYYSGGTQWGELFQQPLVVLILAGVVTGFGLSLFGVHAVFTPKVINELGQKAEQQEGLPSAYFTGVLATMLGTACTAPFLSAALGAANDFGPFRGALIFFAVGLGMAAPFFLLSAVPAWLKYVPKPGKWMGTFEAVMGFILLATVVWILNPIRGQLGDFGLLMSMLFLLGVAAAVWVRGKGQFGAKPAVKRATTVGFLAILALAWIIPFQLFTTVAELQATQAREHELITLGRIKESEPQSGDRVAWDTDSQWERSGGEIPWLSYHPDYVERYVDAGYVVFVDFTADWCASCKTNLKTSIDIEQTRQLMQQLDVVPFEGDYTVKVPTITKALQRYQRAGVPLYLVFRPNQPNDPIVLPELLTPGMVAEALKSAGETRLANAKD